MHEAWQPDEVSLTAQLRMQGIEASTITEELVREFVSFWMTKPVADSQGGWCHRLVKHAGQERTRNASKPGQKPKANWAGDGVFL